MNEYIKRLNEVLICDDGVIYNSYIKKHSEKYLTRIRLLNKH